MFWWADSGAHAPITAVSFLSQLAEAFGATDVTETLSIAGALGSLDEYWSSELCFKMVSRLTRLTPGEIMVCVLLVCCTSSIARSKCFPMSA